jgi:aspartyl-tRNA synthetase
MSFAKGEQVMQVIEKLLVVLWEQMLGEKIEQPIPRMTYHNAMAKYGSDKPDLRLGMEVKSSIFPTTIIPH